MTGKPEDIHQNGSLWLKNVNSNHAGKYVPSVYDDGQEKGNLKPMVLCVIGWFQMVLTTVMCNNVATYVTKWPMTRMAEDWCLFYYRLEEGHNTQAILSSFKARKLRFLLFLKDLADYAEQQC